MQEEGHQKGERVGRDPAVSVGFLPFPGQLSEFSHRLIVLIREISQRSGWDEGIRNSRCFHRGFRLFRSFHLFLRTPRSAFHERGDFFSLSRKSAILPVLISCLSFQNPENFLSFCNCFSVSFEHSLVYCAFHFSRFKPEVIFFNWFFFSCSGFFLVQRCGSFQFAKDFHCFFRRKR